MNGNHYTSKLLLVSSLLLINASLAQADNFDLQKEQNKLSDRVFKHYDNDKNQQLSLVEFTLFSKDMKRKELEKRMAKMTKLCDKNGDGKIERSEVPTEEEIMKLFEKRGFERRIEICHLSQMEFTEIDQNEDNITSPEEMISFYDEFRYHRPKMRVPDKKEQEKRDLKDFKQRLQMRCDTNKDANITLVEISSEPCFMTSDVFLQYSSDPKGSFEIDKITKAPTYENENFYLNMLDRCDKDRDQKLDLVEATSNICHLSSNEFTKIDQDKNALLDKSELTKKSKEMEEPPVPTLLNEKMLKHMPPQVQVRMAFSMCDKNEDGNFTLSEAEACKLSIETFKRFDADKSNSIEMNDIKKMEELEEFKRVDMNDDKSIDPKEFAERMGNRCRVF